MANDDKIWIGVDPGGIGNFGLAIIKTSSSAHICSVDSVDQAIEVVCEHVKSMPSGIGVDAPLWWSSGTSSLRRADEWIREKHNLPTRNVQAVNSLWGSVLAQGLMFVERIRARFPDVPVTETHPKAILKVLGDSHWERLFDELPPKNKLVKIKLSAKEKDNERDALIAATAARESFEKRWLHDLSITRHESEQDPKKHWISPVHYFWPGPEQESR